MESLCSMKDKVPLIVPNIRTSFLVIIYVLHQITAEPDIKITDKN